MNIRKLSYKAYLSFNRSLKFLEKAQVQNPDAPLPFRPLFILGAPRCGSTLIYQNLASTLDLAYLSNLHCFWFGAPWLIERITSAPNKFRNNPVYNSKLGFTKGMFAPSECGEFWYRFFRRFPQYVNLDDCDKTKMKELRVALHALTQAAGKPILFKNLLTVLRLQPLIETIPEALFIVIHREEIDIAHSILEARKRMSGHYNSWFSLQPPNIEQIRTLSPEKQVVEQIRSTYTLINIAKDKYPNTPFFHINYKDFCNYPNDSIQEIKNFLNQHNAPVNKIGDTKSHFEIRSEIKIEQDLYNSLYNYIENN